MRALADNRDNAALLGIPVRKVEAFAWFGSGILFGISGLLLASLVSMEIAALTFTLPVAALAAALIGKVQSLADDGGRRVRDRIDPVVPRRDELARPVPHQHAVRCGDRRAHLLRLAWRHRREGRLMTDTAVPRPERRHPTAVDPHGRDTDAGRRRISTSCSSPSSSCPSCSGRSGRRSCSRWPRTHSSRSVST